MLWSAHRLGLGGELKLRRFGRDLLSATVLTVVLASGAAGQQTARGDISLSRTRLECPGSVRVSGESWVAGIPLEIFFDGEKIGEAIPQGETRGVFSTRVRIPAAPLGTHEIRVDQSGVEPGLIRARATIECIGALAFTGTNTVIWLLIAVALVAVGSAMVLAAPPRYRHARTGVDRYLRRRTSLPRRRS